MSIDRVEVNRALAKSIAFKAVGNDAAARYWAAQVVSILECADILDQGYVRGEYVATMHA
jgi:hypothetical protein